ncbi:MAG: hypothetical protein AAFR35_15740 [Pseudomonadota bacterium]
MILRRRSRRTRGFMVAEALVSLSVAALTLVLLTSATWGIRHATALTQDAPAEARDWLAARRALQAWSAAVVTQGRSRTLGTFAGDGGSVRFAVPPSLAGPRQPYVSELRVDFQDGTYFLRAIRDHAISDTRLTSANRQVSEILSTTQPIRLKYLTPDPTRPGFRWTYSVNVDDALPRAVGVEVDGAHVLTAQLLSTVSPTCFASMGPAGLQNQECETR